MREQLRERRDQTNNIVWEKGLGTNWKSGCFVIWDEDESAWFASDIKPKRRNKKRRILRSIAVRPFSSGFVSQWEASIFNPFFMRSPLPAINQRVLILLKFIHGKKKHLIPCVFNNQSCWEPESHLVKHPARTITALIENESTPFWPIRFENSHSFCLVVSL